jgi:capping protein beta
MRNSLSEVYFGKTKDVVQELRTLENAAKSRQEQSLRRNLFEEMGGKMNKRTTGGL